MEGVYRFLRSPRWLVAHVLLVAVAAACVSLGLWQLRRLDERRAFNAGVARGLAAAEVPLGGVLDEPSAGLAYRRVAAVGRYLPGEEVLVGPRSRDGAPGYEVLTPLVTASGGILVDRGWVPFALSRPPVAQAAPPDGEVTVSGYLLPGRPARRAVPVGASRLDVLSDPDVERVGEQVSVPLAPVYLVLLAQSPEPGGLPRPGVLPQLGEGPHLSYAGQWFLFAAVAVVGYPFLIRRRAREVAGPPGGPPPSPPTGSSSAPTRSRLRR
ncbi:MAG: SURF1 family protein [Egibacteraceae bacterium]